MKLYPPPPPLSHATLKFNKNCKLLQFFVIFSLITAFLSAALLVSCKGAAGADSGDNEPPSLYTPVYSVMSTGGTVTYLDGTKTVQTGGPNADTAFVVHLFSADGTFALSRAPSGNAAATLVAGGGGGGGGPTGFAADYAGGGGAGGVKENIPLTLSVGSYEIRVGLGGTHDTVSANPLRGLLGKNGGDTLIELAGDALASATGGGAGGAGGGASNGQDGGSGGGGAEGGMPTVGAGGNAESGQGNAGAAATGGDQGGGGGGGAGGVASGVIGGAGITLTLPAGILEGSYTVAAGGAGANSLSPNDAAADGASYGSGGGGAKGHTGGSPGAENGGDGADGVCVIIIPYAPEQVPAP
jgi:hypothetical protein